MVTPDDDGGAVYQGGLYIGQTPLLIELPIERSVFFHVETPEGRTGSAVRSANSGADFIFVETRPPNQDRRVARARRSYYGAWARFWVALPAAYILQGVSLAQTNAFNAAAAANAANLEEYHRTATNSRRISLGAWVVFGLVSAEVVVRTVLYLHSAWRDANPMESTVNVGGR
jgi:hypothetical protein